MRVRLVLAMAIVGAVVVVVGFGVALGTGSSDPTRTASVSVDVSTQSVGAVQPVSVELPGANAGNARVFVVRETKADIVAFLGRSTAIPACALAWVHDPDRVALTSSPSVVFEDPCGGAFYTLDGTCIAGPCRRGLDHFASHVAHGRLTIDLAQLDPGAPRS